MQNDWINVQSCGNVFKYVKKGKKKSSESATITVNIKKITFGNKEHTTDKKIGVLILLRFFISTIEICSTAYALKRIYEQNSIFKYTTMGPMIPKEMKSHDTNTSCSVVK